MKKKLFCSLLVACMLLSLLPANTLPAGAAAQAESAPPAAPEGVTYAPLESLPSYRSVAFQAAEWNDTEQFTDGVYEGYRAQLDGASQALYDRLKEAAAHMWAAADRQTVTITADTTAPGWTAQVLAPAWYALERDHPEWPWLHGTEVHFSVPVLESAQVAVTITGISPELPGGQAAFSAAVAEAAAEIPLDMSREDQLRAIHDYLCQQVVYDGNAASSQTAYSALVNGQAACAGYAAAFKALCDRAEIPCVYVSGQGVRNTGTEPHAWNYVKVNDGWYAMDVTWDDTGADWLEHTYFLVGSSTIAAGWMFQDSHIEANVWTADEEWADTVVFPYPLLRLENFTYRKEVMVFGTLSATVDAGQTLGSITEFDFSPGFHMVVDGNEFHEYQICWEENPNTVLNEPGEYWYPLFLTPSGRSDGPFNETQVLVAVTVLDPAADYRQEQVIQAGDLTVAYGDIGELAASASGGGALTYAAANPEVIDIDGSGRITARAPGTTEVTICAAGVGGLRDSGGYKPAVKTVTVTVTRRALTAVLHGTVEKVYDGTTSAGRLNGGVTLEGVVGADSVSVTAVPGQYPSADAGEDYPVVLTLSQLSGEAADCYTLPANTLTVRGVITGRPITEAAVVQAGTLTYNGGVQTGDFVVTLDGRALTPGTDYTISGNRAAGAGETAITVTGTGNYTGTAAGRMTIEKATPTVTAAVGTIKIGAQGAVAAAVWGAGGAALDAPALTYKSDNEAVATVDAQGNVTGVAEGTASITVTFAGDGNYHGASALAAVTVESRSLTGLTLAGTPDRTAYEYGDVFDRTGLTVTAHYDDGSTAEVTSQATVSPGVLAVGTRAVTLTYMGQSVSVPGITVTRKKLDVTGVTWNEAARYVFNGTQQELLLVNEEAVPAGVTITKTGHLGTNAGSYTACAVFALAEGYDAANYEITGAAGPLTASWQIAKAAGTVRTLTISVNCADTTEQRLDLLAYVPQQGGALEGAVALTPDTVPVPLRTLAVTEGAVITFALAEGAGAGEVRFEAVFHTKNYSAVTVQVTLNLLSRKTPVLRAERTSLRKVYDGLPVTAADFGPEAIWDGVPVSGSWSLRLGEEPVQPVSAADSGAGYTLYFVPDRLEEYAEGAVPAPIEVSIQKAVPAYSLPAGLEIAAGAALSTVPLPSGWAWQAPSTVVTGTGAFPAVYTPADRVNYHTVEQDLTVTVPSGGPSGTAKPSSGGNSGGFAGPPAPSGAVSTGSGGSSGTVTTLATDSVLRSGTAVSAVSSRDMEEAVAQASAGSSGEVVIAPEIAGNPDRVQVSLPAASVGQVGRRTAAGLTVRTPMGDVTLANASLDRLSSGGGSVVVGVERVSGSAYRLSITANGQEVTALDQEVVFRVPCPGADPGTVAVLVGEDGSRSVIRRSAAGKDVIHIPLDGSAYVELLRNGRRFSDVPDSSWAFPAVSFVSGHELFRGTGAGLFSPDQHMTRGMLAVVLHNLENNPGGAPSPRFSDVEDGAYYASAIAWAFEQGIVSGYGGGVFGVNDGVTREQLAVMLYRAAGSPPADGGQSGSFSDAASVSEYARAGVNWAADQGILNGVGGGVLDPQGLATRAQVAQMIKRYVETRL